LVTFHFIEDILIRDGIWRINLSKLFEGGEELFLHRKFGNFFGKVLGLGFLKRLRECLEWEWVTKPQKFSGFGRVVFERKGGFKR